MEPLSGNLLHHVLIDLQPQARPGGHIHVAILILEDLDGTQYFTCYDFLTLNNILYRKKHVIAEEGSPCA